VRYQEPEDFSRFKLFCPWGGATWLLTELDPEDPSPLAFAISARASPNSALFGSRITGAEMELNSSA
jgi:hypothetical protein